MQIDKQPLVLCKDDYELLTAYLRDTRSQKVFNPQEAEELQAELKRARLVPAGQIPADTVRVGSRVTIREAGKVIELTLVTPDKANIKERKVSVMAPIGAALIGFRKGQQVQWKVPAGLKTFTIEEVENGERKSSIVNGEKSNPHDRRVACSYATPTGRDLMDWMDERT